MNLHVIEKTCNDDLNINKVEVDEKSILKFKIIELTNKVTELEERLKKYTNGSNHKRYYEKNKEKIKESGSNYLQKLKMENPEKLKEYSKRAYANKKKKQTEKENSLMNDTERIIDERTSLIDNLEPPVIVV
jgi:hypothetical protein